MKEFMSNEGLPPEQNMIRRYLHDTERSERRRALA